ncbi:MAG: 50S ribosomal protein L18 [Candidatus Margulisbacteria bacterium]|nr:50S ribosomal protein L18 [Candidatus Margulisiibacteriota bacterium]
MKKKKIFGTKERPRLSVFRGLKNIHAQIIDDAAGKTLAAVTSLKMKKGGNIAAAKQVGQQMAEKAKAVGITQVVFDRGAARYHGRVKALADAAREGGLIF